MRRVSNQQFSFNSVEELLDFLPGDERRTCEFLRRLVLDTIPQCTERLSNNIPSYYRHSRICYIWPAAAARGNVPQYGVQLGFFQGSLLTDEERWLERGRRIKVFTKTFADIDEIEVDVIKAFLFEAVEIDEHRRIY